MIEEKITTDVLVIGAGAGGIRAALAASEAGVDVVLVTKGKVTRSGSTFSSLSKGWGIQALVGEERTNKGFEEFYNDIISVGLGICDPKLVQILVEESGPCLEELISFGLNFRKDPEGKYLRIGGCFCDVKRAFVTESLPNIQETFSAMIKTSGAKVVRGTIIGLTTFEGTCWGGWFLDPEQRLVKIDAKATILATGGGGAIFRDHLVTEAEVGEGYSLAFQAGVELANMEFIQFMLGLKASKRCYFFPIAELENQEVMVDEYGHDILVRYLPGDAERFSAVIDRQRHFPFSYRDNSFRVDMAVAKENRDGRKVFRRDRDKKGSVEEILHCAHAFNGGVKIDEHAESTLNGLFAVGEVATGPHGADRIGGCMMAAIQVFGRRAGKFAAERAKSLEGSNFPDIAKMGGREDLQCAREDAPPFPISDLTGEVRETMSMYAGVLRTEDGLKRCKEALSDCETQLREMKLRGAVHTGKYIELSNMIRTGKLITDAALKRKESKGSHYREDYG